MHPLRRIRISAKMGGLPSSTGQLPSAADGSRIDAIPTDGSHQLPIRGGPPSTYAVWSRCRISGPSAVRTLSIRRLGCPATSQGPRHLCPLVPGALAPSEIGVRTSQGPWHLRLPLQAPSALRVRAFGTCAPRWPQEGVSGPSAPTLPASLP